VQLKSRLRYDDELDVVGVHMVGGVIGVLLTGVFASLAVNAAGAAGGWVQFGRQAGLAATALVFPFVATFAVLWVTDHLVGLRVSAEEEAVGLDIGEHAEVAYALPELIDPEGHGFLSARTAGNGSSESHATP